jgi:hypothetical protein
MSSLIDVIAALVLGFHKLAEITFSPNVALFSLDASTDQDFAVVLLV